MRIISWNINGIRAIHKRGDFDWVLKESPDIVFLQETKAEFDQLPQNLQEFNDYYCHFVSSRARKGYSGVAMYSKILPDKVTEMDEDEFNTEGRTIFAYFGKTVLITGYFPNGGQGPHRLEYKLKFYDAFLKKINKLNKAGYAVIFCGDVNTAHTEIDLARPKANEKNTGFLPVERSWIDRVIKSGFTDVFRHFYPNQKDVYTYWDQKTASRTRNVGWRIDYFFANDKAMKLITGFTTHTNVIGSDHCPIEIKIKTK
jgi:exodeoxyribonuclease-3